jgi:hypothetical protein
VTDGRLTEVKSLIETLFFFGTKSRFFNKKNKKTNVSTIVKQLFCEKANFYILLYMPVKRLNSCSVKKVYSYMLLYKQYAVNFQKKLPVVAKNLLNILLPELKITLRHFTIIKCTKMYTNYRHFVTIFVT